MVASHSTLTKICPMLAIAYAFAAFAAAPAGAQTANNVICNGCVDSTDIQNNSVTALDTANEAGLEFDFEGHRSITAADSTAISLHVSAPTFGWVTIMATGTFHYIGTDATARCSLTNQDTNTVNFSNDIAGFVSAETRAVPFSAVRTFSQNTGTHRYRLNCDFASATGTVWIDDLNMVAIFVPTAY
jgi:hypothetical protein